MTWITRTEVACENEEEDEGILMRQLVCAYAEGETRGYHEIDRAHCPLFYA